MYVKKDRTRENLEKFRKYRGHKTRGRFPSNVTNAGGNSKRWSLLMIMYTIADGLVGTGKDLELNDRVDWNKPDTICRVETKLREDDKSHERYT